MMSWVGKCNEIQQGNKLHITYIFIKFAYQ
jgi:hypothetical protein